MNKRFFVTRILFKDLLDHTSYVPSNLDSFNCLSYLLFAICYLLFVICYLLFAICYLLFAVQLKSCTANSKYWLTPNLKPCLSSAGHIFTISTFYLWLLFVICYLLFAICCTA